jgi:hypothetical protein
MMAEDVAEDGKIRVDGGDLAILGLERRAESLQSRGGGELIDLVVNLLGDELPLEICKRNQLMP